MTKISRRLAAIAVSGAMVVGGAAIATPHADASPIPVSACDYGVGTPTIYYGSTGPAVKQLQCLLDVRFHYTLKRDGIFGTDTLYAVKSFQRSHGLTADGVVGRLTWNALDS